MSNLYCNDNFPDPESCADEKRVIDTPPKDPCFEKPEKFDRDLPFCTTIAVEGGQPNTIILPLVKNVFSFEVENDANVPFTFEWFLGCPDAPIRQLDPSEVESIVDTATKTTITFRPSHLAATGVALVTDATPGNVIKSTTGLFAIAKSRCGDFFSDCIDELGLLPHEIQEFVNAFSPFAPGIFVREHVAAFAISFDDFHFVREFANAFGFVPEDPHLVSEFINSFGFVGSHPDQDKIFA